MKWNKWLTCSGVCFCKNLKRAILYVKSNSIKSFKIKCHDSLYPSAVVVDMAYSRKLKCL